MTMPTHFTENEMLQLVILYKDYDCLWDMTNPLYKDREARVKAYKEICEKLNFRNLTASDIPKKIKNLRSSYYQELKRVRMSVNSGGPVYKPKVPWFNILDDFLRAFKSERDIYSTVSAKSLKGIPNNENVNNEIANTDKIAKTVISSNKKDDRDDESNKGRKRKFSSLSSAASIQEEGMKITDEFDSFGNYIATTLRAMRQEFSIIAKTELQKTLSDIQLRIIRQSHLNTSAQSPLGASTSSDYENHQSGCLTPTSDSFIINTIKVEYDS